MKYLFKTIALILIAALVFCGCDNIAADLPKVSLDGTVFDTPPKRSAYPVSFDGESFDHSPLSVVSLSPAITDVMMDMDLGVRLIGVSDYCNEPYEGVAKVGSPALPDFARITELKPEMVITQSPLGSADVVKLKNEGIRVLYMPLPTDYSHLCEEYFRISMIFYGAVDSKDYALNALEEIDSVMNDAAKTETDKSFVIINEKVDGLYAVSTGNSIASSMISVFGKNLLADSDKRLLTSSELSSLSPDIVIIADGVEGAEKIYGADTAVIKADISRFDRPSASLADVMRDILTKIAS